MPTRHNLKAEGWRVLLRSDIPLLDYARSIVLPDGDLAGTFYDPASHQAQHCLLQAIQSGYGHVSILKPVQDGGSLASFIPIMRRAHLLGQNAIISYPTMDSAKDAWTKKVWPMLSAQGGTQPKKGGGSRGGAARVVQLPSGGCIILRAAGGRQESGQASITADVLLVDEVDDWADMRVLRLIERRLSRSRDPLSIFISTCKRDALDGVEESRIVRMFDAGTKTRLTYPCPHCGHRFKFDLSVLDHENGCIVCPDCKQGINETQRLAMLKQWERLDECPDAVKFSIMWTALESPFSMLYDGRRLPVIDALCLEYHSAMDAAARTDHGLIRQYYRDRWCRPYRGDIDDDENGQTNIPTRSRLAALSSVSSLPLIHDEKDIDTHHWVELPSWVDHLTIGCDVQAGGERSPALLYWIAYGGGDSRACIPAWGTVQVSGPGGQPSEQELHNALNKLNSYILQWNPGIPIVSRGVDTGNGVQTDELLRWLSVHKEWHAVKGVWSLKMQPQDAKDRAGWIYVRQLEKYVLRHVDTENVTRQVHGELLARQSPPVLELPQGLDKASALVRHICSTVEVLPGVWSSKKESTQYEHKEYQTRNDYMDALAYARALSYEYQTKPKKTNGVKYGVVKRASWY
jgi:hypothetical protein